MKRSLDIVGASVALVGLAPVIAVVAVLVRLRLGRPVLFVQERPGRNGVPFRLYKFRTMHDVVDAAGQPVADDARLTRFGRALRATSLDELPELVNVLRGDMSLVGPRPLLVAYMPHYSAEQARRHDVRPGLTGLAQVKARNEDSWDDRLATDVWYVDNWSLGLDLRIMLRTVPRVLSGAGVTANDHATMRRFDDPPVEDPSGA